MATFICGNPSCKKEFKSKHSTAKFCSRRCSGIVSVTTEKAMALRAKQPNRYTEENLLQLITTLAENLGRTPTIREVGVARDAFRSIFGGYNNAVIAAGLEPNRSYAPSYYEGERHLVPIGLRFNVLKRDGFTCAYCGGSPKMGFLLHVDHILARSKGGTTSLDNLITSCSICNFGKSDT